MMIKGLFNKSEYVPYVVGLLLLGVMILIIIQFNLGIPFGSSLIGAAVLSAFVAMIHQEIAWHRSLSARLLRSGLGLVLIIALIIFAVPKGEALRFFAWAIIGCVVLEMCGWIGIGLWRIAQLFVSPPYFYSRSVRLIPWFGWISLLLMLVGLYGGLVLAPPDYQQGDAYRIIFVHVPAAWLSLFVYVVMATLAAIGLIWKIKMAEVLAASCAPIGAAFTILALATGSLWGKPMWGTWWEWDARLTSELILLFLYLGFMGLQTAIEDKRTAAHACAILALVGVVNIPIIHYSVEWWNSLHQGASVTKLDKPSIEWDMLRPLLYMSVAFMLYFITTLLMRARCELLQRERNSEWVQKLVSEL